MPQKHLHKCYIRTKHDNHVAIISLSGRFTFEAHRTFKAAYMASLEHSGIACLIVDLQEIEYLDSSALGMLLMLREHAGEARKTLELANPSPITARTFDIAGFYRMFVIKDVIEVLKPS